MKLSLFNFPARDSIKFEKILQLSKTRQYKLTVFDANSEIDLVLVYGIESLESPKLHEISTKSPTKVVVISKHPPTNKSYHHIPSPLIASRVLKVLEHISSKNAKAENVVTQTTKLAQTQTKPATTRIEKPIVKNPSTTMAKVSQPTISASSSVQKPHVFEGNKKKSFRVLIVDDSVPMQRALEAELKRLEALTEIDFADNGEMALEFVDKNQYDFIFLDIIMPGIDGFETCTRMREKPALKRVPIIMLSSKNSPLDEVKGVMAGCSTYMTKPIDHEEFQKVIRRISKWVENFSTKNRTVKAD